MEVNDQEIKIDSDKLSFWGNPIDERIYATYGAPNYSFSEVGAYPVYDMSVKAENYNLLKTGKADEIHKSPWLGEFYEKYQEWHSLMLQGGAQKMAAQTSGDHTAIEVLNVHAEVFGRRERIFAGKNLAQIINVPQLVIDIDTLKKYGNMERLGELMVPKPKIVKYTRAHFEAVKWGLIFETSEEDQLKNIHNPHQDAITIAGTKVESRGSFDVIEELLLNLTTLAVVGSWETFEAGADRSDFNPQIDIGKVQLNTDGTGIGGRMNRVGMHQLTLARWRANSFNRGLIAPTVTTYEPGSEPLGGGMDGIATVKDQMIDQGVALCVSTEVEPTCAYFQGPQRVASEHNNITGSDVYGIFDFHLAAIINSLTGRKLTAATVPIAW